MSIAFKVIEHGSSDYRSACFLRDALLRAPLGMDLFAEDLAAESDLVHVGGFGDEDRVIAYLQFKPLEAGVLKMQQVVVASKLQGSGKGRELIDFAECVAINHDAAEIVLHAREEVVGFYQSLGYEREGDRFIEIGIPHFKMRKKLG